MFAVAGAGVPPGVGEALAALCVATMRSDGRFEVVGLARMRLLVEEDPGRGDAATCLRRASCARAVARGAGLERVVVVTLDGDASSLEVGFQRFGPVLDRAWPAEAAGGLHAAAQIVRRMALVALESDATLLDVRAGGAAGEVRVDGVVVGRAPLHRLEVAPGLHDVSIRLAGGAVRSVRVRCAPQSVCVADLAPPPATGPPRRPAAGPGALEVGAWVTLGAAVASLAVGAGMMGWSAQIEADLDAACAAGVCDITRAEATARADRGEAAAVAGAVLLGVGAASAVTSFALFAADARGAAAEAASGVLPLVDARGAIGASVSLPF